MRRKQCGGECGKTLPLSAYHKNKTRKDGYNRVCKQCRKAYSAAWYQGRTDRQKKLVTRRRRELRTKAREFVAKYLSLHPCVDCGEQDIVVLDFDHVRGTKKKAISHMLETSISKIKSEIAKCDVRCANCHRRKTAKELGSYRLVFRSPAGGT